MLRILWGSPLPPLRSGVSDYAAELLQELAALAKVRVLRPPGWEGEVTVPGIELVSGSTPPAEGEIVLIHLGNNPYHLWLLDHLRDTRLVLVLHDLVLHHLLVEATLATGDEAAYRRRMIEAYGDAGAALADGRHMGFEAPLDPFLFPARAPFLKGARAAVVHSRWAKHQVASEFPSMPVLNLAMPAHDPGTGIDRMELRRTLGIAKDELLVMHLGFLTPAKGLATILEALSVVTTMGRPVRLLLVGEGVALETIRRAADKLGIGQRVSATGWTAYERFVSLPAAADLGLVLRSPSAGETSAAVVRFLACGTPVAVSGLHQFLEWPSSAVERVTPGPSSTASLVRILLDASARLEDGTAQRRRDAARTAYVSGGHQPARVSRQLAAFLRGLRL